MLASGAPHGHAWRVSESWTKSPARGLLIVPVVIGLFVGADVLTQRQSEGVRRVARQIERVGRRSSLLSLCRGHLHEMGMALADALGAARPFDRASFDRGAFDRDRGALDQALAAFRAAPPAVPEDARAADVIGRIDTATRALDRTATLVEAGALDEARQVDHRAAVRPAGRAIGAMLDVDADRIRLLSEQIASIDARQKRVAPLLDAAAALVSLVLMVIAVHTVRQYARLANERNQLAERRADELEIFAARVAHDLKNPLGALSLRIATLRRRLGDERGDLDRLSGVVERMQGIIGGLLDFARSGGRPERAARADVAETLTELIADFLPEAEHAGATLTTEPFAPVAVACPPAALASVLSNLLRNAVKYVVEGSGERRVVVRVAPRGERVGVEVEDTGPGVAPEAQHAIFEPFVRAGTRTQPGVGLGLATVKRIVEAYEGAVGVDSRPGEGSRFWIELPRAAPDAEASLHVH